MTEEYNEQQRRLFPYLPLIDGGQKLALYPPPGGIEANSFEYVDHNGTHFKIRDFVTGREMYLPFVLVEFINPAPQHGHALVRLTRKVGVQGNSFV